MKVYQFDDYHWQYEAENLFDKHKIEIWKL